MKTSSTFSVESKAEYDSTFYGTPIYGKKSGKQVACKCQETDLLVDPDTCVMYGNFNFFGHDFVIAFDVSRDEIQASRYIYKEDSFYILQEVDSFDAIAIYGPYKTVHYLLVREDTKGCLEIFRKADVASSNVSILISEEFGADSFSCMEVITSDVSISLCDTICMSYLLDSDRESTIHRFPINGSMTLKKMFEIVDSGKTFTWPTQEEYISKFKEYEEYGYKFDSSYRGKIITYENDE